MTRLKKTGSGKRTLIIRVRVTSAEKSQLITAASEGGLSISDWIRMRAIGVKPLIRKPTPAQEILHRLLAQFGRVGNLCNQLARHMNRKDLTGTEAPAAEITYVMGQLKEVTGQLRDALD